MFSTVTTPRTIELLVTQLVEAAKSRGYDAQTTEIKLGYITAYHQHWRAAVYVKAGPHDYAFADTAEAATDALTDKIAQWPVRWTIADVAATLGIERAA